MMDSRLDSIFRTNFQPAERADTWLGIRREEPQNDQRRKHSGKQIREEEETEDAATLSVLSLHGFLKMLLVQAGEQPSPPSSPAAPPERDHPVSENNASRAAARAANAYQNTARAAPGSHIDLTETAPSPASAGPALALSGEELRVIHQLLRDVETLAERGTATINLHPGDRFLDSLAIGVREALSPSSGTT
jgi:hypothetical protein